MKKFIFSLSVVLSGIWSIVSVCALLLVVTTLIFISDKEFMTYMLMAFNILMWVGLASMFVVTPVLTFLPKIKYEEKDPLYVNQAGLLKGWAIFSASCFAVALLMKLLVFHAWLHMA